MVFESRDLWLSVLTLQFMLVFSMYWNIPIVRQVLGFLYLTFVPGIVILKFLKLKQLSLAEMVPLSVGLSIAFLMFFGCLLNHLLPLIGFSEPLSGELLAISLSLLITFSSLVSYFKENAVNNMRSHFSFFNLAMFLILACFPFLSIVGTFLMSTNGNNLLLLLTMVLVPTLTLMVVVLHRKFSFDIFPVALLIVYIAILFATWLTTRYVLGYDSHFEFYSFRITENASFWNLTRSFEEIDKGNAMLSITVLPTLYSKILGLEATWVFKIIYPLLAAFVPFSLYQFFLTHAKKNAAFLGTFLFITHSLDGLGSIKEWIATIFYVLLFLVIFSNKISSSKRKILYIIFSGALVVSHYSKSYIFMFILILMWTFSFILKKNVKVTLSMVLIYLSMAFAWYVFTIQGLTFEALLSTVNNIYRSLTTEFFNPASRGSTVMIALGLVGPPTYLHLLSRVFFYLTLLLIVIGFISVALRFWKKRCNIEYFILVCVNTGLLAMTIILPNLAESYRMTRFYRTALIVLAPLCFIGSEEIIANLHRIRLASLQRKCSALALTAIILLPFFLFQTGFIYEVAKVECWSVPLSGYRMPPVAVSERILRGTEVLGAIWLSEYENTSLVYSDFVSMHSVLISYGLINYARFRTLRNNTRTVDAGSVIYLRSLNTIHNTMISFDVLQWNTTNLQPFFDAQDMIYSNGECIIYKQLP